MMKSQKESFYKCSGEKLYVDGGRGELVFIRQGCMCRVHGSEMSDCGCECGGKRRWTGGPHLGWSHDHRETHTVLLRRYILSVLAIPVCALACLHLNVFLDRPRDESSCYKLTASPTTYRRFEPLYHTFRNVPLHQTANMAPGGRGRAGKFSKPTRGGQSPGSWPRRTALNISPRGQEIQQEPDTPRCRRKSSQYVGGQLSTHLRSRLSRSKTFGRTCKTVPRSNLLHRKRTTMKNQARGLKSLRKKTSRK